MAVQEYTSFSDLKGLGSSPCALRKKFEDIYGLNPDGLAVNKETYYDAVVPAITEQYDHWCYKTLAQTTFGKDLLKDPKEIEVGSAVASNQSDTEITISLSITGTWVESIGYTSKVSEGMSFSTPYSIEGNLSMGMPFELCIEPGKSETTTTQVTDTAKIQVTVPAQSFVKVSMVGAMLTENLEFSTPIDVTGMWGANFPDPVQGHYFWFEPSGNVLPKTQGLITGVITGTAPKNIHCEIGDPIPINPNIIARNPVCKVKPNTYIAKGNYKFIKAR